MRPKTRTKLLEAAAEILVRNSAASLDEIAEAADVSRATAYRHFSSRPDLLKALLEEVASIVDETVEGILTKRMPAAETLKALLEALIPLGPKVGILSKWVLFETEESLTRLLDRRRHEWYLLVKWFQKKGVLSKTIPVEWAAGMIDAVIATSWELIDRGDLAPNAASSLAMKTIEQGLHWNQ